MDPLSFGKVSGDDGKENLLLTNTNCEFLLSSATKVENILTSTAVLLRFCGISLPKDHFFLKLVTIALGSALWILFLAISVVFIEKCLHGDQIEFNIGATIVWCLHAASVYSIVAYDMTIHRGRLELNIWEMADDDFMPGRCDNLTDPSQDFKKMKQFSMRIAVFIITCGIANWIVSFATFVDSFSNRMLPTGDSVFWNVVVVSLWFPFCICWFLPLYFICVPCKLLLCRVNRYILYLSKDTINNFDVISAMRFYDRLCHVNRRFNRSIVSLATISCGLLVVHGITLLMVNIYISNIIKNCTFLNFI